jgi:ribonucleoside-diphosphate reductase alpha chain/ribonucleoside-triphosphate reductase
VGGIRRSSTIAFGEKDDLEFLNSKSNLYIQDERGVWTFNEEIANRQLSNNTVYYHSKPNRQELHEHIQKMKLSGEPALLNAEEALRRNPNFKLTNPCGGFRLM